MLYKIAHFLRDKMSFLWRLIEFGNSFLFKCRYGSKMNFLPLFFRNKVAKTKNGDTISFRLATANDTEPLECFFKKQPVDSFRYFNPHPFDRVALDSLIRQSSFIAMVAIIDEEIVGYFFLRSFFHGKCFLGKMVDSQSWNLGIGRAMCQVAMDVASQIGLRMFESINHDNKASLLSSSVLKQVVVKELDNGDVLIEDFPL